MKSILYTALVLGSLNVFSQKIPEVNVLNYRFNITLNDLNDTIDCSAVVTLKTGSAGRAELDLISSKPSGKGMKISGIRNEENKQSLSYTHSEDIVRINTAGATKIRINYKGIPADGLIISKNKYGQRSFFSDNWPNRGRNWLVCNDHPSDKASVDFIVTAPAHYQVVSNGMQIEETNLNGRLKLTHWQETIDLPVKVMCIGVAEFAVGYAGNAGDVPIYSWVYPMNKTEGFADYKDAVGILPFFIKNIAPFPYKKLANVQSKTIFGGLENAGAIFYGENSVTGAHGAELLIAHELVHQWFGDMVTETDWQHIWLSEGFATYLSLLYLETRYGPDSLIKELIKNRKQVITYHQKVQRPVVDSTVKEYLQHLNTNTYQKGGWVLRMLHQQLGDSIFWKGIRTYYTTYAGKNAGTDDFRKIMEEVSGRDLKKFFTQWLYRSGHPVIHTTHTYADKALNVTITQEQDDPFDFPLMIQVKSADTEFTKSIHVDKKTTRFSIPMDAELSSFIIDPATSLLFEEK
mgnify:CR=1 FL=1